MLVYKVVRGVMPKNVWTSVAPKVLHGPIAEISSFLESGGPEGPKGPVIFQNFCWLEFFGFLKNISLTFYFLFCYIYDIYFWSGGWVGFVVGVWKRV
jgi:hypothetical protein